MNYELGRDENAPLCEKSIGCGVVHRAGEDFLLKCVHYTVSTQDKGRRTEDGGRETEAVVSPRSYRHQVVSVPKGDDIEDFQAFEKRA